MSGVPVCGRPYGWKPYTSRSNTALAMNPGSSKLTWSDDSELLALPIDLRLRERRMPRHVGQHAEPRLEAVLHHDHVQVAQIGAGARAGDAADEVDRVVELLGRLRARLGALIEQRRREMHEAELALRIRRAARPDQQPHADGRLLVMEHDHHLQAVRERLHLVRRERRRCARPAAAAAAPTASARLRASRRAATRRRQPQRHRAHRDRTIRRHSGLSVSVSATSVPPWLVRGLRHCRRRLSRRHQRQDQAVLRR